MSKPRDGGEAGGLQLHTSRARAQQTQRLRVRRRIDTMLPRTFSVSGISLTSPRSMRLLGSPWSCCPVRLAPASPQASAFHQPALLLRGLTGIHSLHPHSARSSLSTDSEPQDRHQISDPSPPTSRSTRRAVVGGGSLVGDIRLRFPFF